VSNWQYTALIESVASHIKQRLAATASSLEQRQPLQDALLEPQLVQQIEQAQTGVNPAERRVIRQLALIYRLLPELTNLANAFALPATSADAPAAV